MDSEKILTSEEVNTLLRKLQMKYGAEGKQIQAMITMDMTLYGHVTAKTANAQKALSEKIMKERDSYENC